jgi:carboxymethylenebutenolidase
MYGNLNVPVGSGYRRGYLARPDEAGKFPTVLLLPGASGLSSSEKDFSRRLARRGLACLAVDLYPGDDEVLLAYQARSDREILTDLDEAYEFLQSEDVLWAIQGAVGVVGFDIGGRFALILAARRQWVRGCVVVSTPLTGDEQRDQQVAEMLNHLGIPVLGLFGAADTLIVAETVDEAQRRNEDGQWLLYENAGHAFYDDSSPDFDPAAAADAFSRISSFLAACLPAAEIEDLG